MVKTFASDLAARVRAPVGAEVRATLTILQSGDPDVIFTHHARCKDYGVRYDSLYCGITALILTAACTPLLHTPLKHLKQPQDDTAEMLGGEPCGEACLDP